MASILGRLRRLRPFATVVLTLMQVPDPVGAKPIPARFDSASADRTAIQAVLDIHTQAVSTKDQALFETLLLDRTIPFAAVSPTGRHSQRPDPTDQYESSRREVFQDCPFTQRFKHVYIHQDGSLASVSPMFINTASDGTNCDWKTLLPLKVTHR